MECISLVHNSDFLSVSGYTLRSFRFDQSFNVFIGLFFYILALSIAEETYIAYMRIYIVKLVPVM